jgi:hypothetical protein
MQFTPLYGLHRIGKGGPEMEILNDYLVAVVMAICFAIGYIIKHSLDFIPNKFIPLILGVLGVFLNIWLNGWFFTPQILLGGLASGLATTGAFELVKSLKKDNGAMAPKP